MKKPRRHWYFITDFYCPVCAHSDTYRERRYDRRPKDWRKRHEIIDTYDGCLG